MYLPEYLLSPPILHSLTLNRPFNCRHWRTLSLDLCLLLSTSLSKVLNFYDTDKQSEGSIAFSIQSTGSDESGR